MAHLVLCSGAEAARKLKKAGWTVARQKGSHLMMVKAGYFWTLSIPHTRNLARASFGNFLSKPN
jgi:predicted RNA binding protein YcfA (HicA-like mRNA interferase family)